MNFEVKLLNRESIQEQVAIYRESFELEKKESFEKTKEHWINKHYTNPVHDSYVFGAYDDGQIVGINCFLPIVYESRGEKLFAVQSCESGVRISHRRKGIWGQIIRYAMNYFKTETKYDVLIGYPNVNNSYYGFLKLGWKDILHVDNYMMVGNGAEFVKAALNMNKSWSLSNVLGGQRIKCALTDKHGAHVISSIDNLTIDLGGTENCYTLILSEDVLAWKLRYNGASLAMVSLDNGKSIHIIYDIQEYKSSNFLRILCIDRKGCNDSEATGAVASFILWAVKNNLLAFIRVWASGRDNYTPILKKLGFARVKHVNPYIVYALNEAKAKDVYNPQKWLPHFIDLD